MEMMIARRVTIELRNVVSLEILKGVSIDLKLCWAYVISRASYFKSRCYQHVIYRYIHIRLYAYTYSYHTCMIYKIVHHTHMVHTCTICVCYRTYVLVIS